ncbi:MAG: hypothetical protein ABI609_01165 [Acidobacteriota bacterium]
MSATDRGRGRPAKEPQDRRAARLTLNFTQAEHAALVRGAAAEGLALSEYARSAALRRSPARLVPAINRATYENLHRIGANLNQWMHAINAGLLPGVLMPDVRELRGLLREVQAELKIRRGERYLPEMSS